MAETIKKAVLLEKIQTIGCWALKLKSRARAAMAASILVRSVVISEGSGLVRSICKPDIGWAKDRLAACRAWRGKLRRG